ncbi:MAG: GFA family protein [Bdellovibrionales bacterium]
MKHVASCSCGQLSLIYDGEITKTTLCHCFACQKRTGSAFGVQTRLDRNKVAIEGESTLYQRTGDEGNIISFHFCPKCGSTVYYEAPWLEGAIAVPIGAFANPNLPAPAMHVYGNRRHHWVRLPESIVEYFG